MPFVVPCVVVEQSTEMCAVDVAVHLCAGWQKWVYINCSTPKKGIRCRSRAPPPPLAVTVVVVVDVASRWGFCIIIVPSINTYFAAQ